MLTFYVLVWPAVVAVVLVFIARGFLRDWREARRAGRPII